MVEEEWRKGEEAPAPDLGRLEAKRPKRGVKLPLLPCCLLAPCLKEE